jgi:penicillin-binding protein 2
MRLQHHPVKLCLSVIFLLALLLIAGCKRQPPSTPTPTLTPTLTPTPTATLGQPEVITTGVPDPGLVARTYLDAWKAEDYPTMYALLTRISRDAIPQDDFTRRYRDVFAEAALSNVDYDILASFVKSPSSAEVSYRVILHSILVGDIQRDTVMSLSLEEGQWRVQWNSTLILPELTGENGLRMEYFPPSRGNIYDRNGSALVAQSDAWALGLDTTKVDLNKLGGLLSLIYEAAKIRPETLRPKLEAYRELSYYLPVADLSADQIAPYYERLLNYDGVLLQPFRSRYYFDEGIAPHVTGYVMVIHAEDVEKYKRLGYNPLSDRVGAAGLEQWGESYLGGKHGGTLSVVAPDNSIVTILASTDPQAAQAIYTTIDKNLQEQAQLALQGLRGRGAIVVLERDTGRVLAMASSPTYNPNLFEPSNYNSQALLGEVLDPNTTPLLNRATQGQYPLGSVFKIVTISAALQSGAYTPETEYNCRYDFTEIPGVTLYDWTWEHYLKDGRTQASGILTLPQGLMKSCDPYFYHIGLDLFSRGMTTAVTDMAHGFGLGSPTGIEIVEEAGQIPPPASPLDATNQAIGQGPMMVTPLQVADFVAAVGNGGTLYQPKVVEKIVPTSGEPTYVFTPTIRGTLPISPTYLKVVQDAMVTVLGPNGTARSVGNYLSSYNIPAAGKTGTAQTGYTDPHAWFVGYTFANKPDKPDIAVAIILEYTGEGSEWAAPIFSAMVRLYFYPDKPREPFRWESAVGVPKPTPTPTFTPTPKPEPTETPTPEP